MTPEQIYALAREAGNNSVRGKIDGYPCGFAWLNIKPARGPFVKFLKANNIGRRDDYYGGYTLSSYDCCDFNGQSVYVKTDGVAAFLSTLLANGINANLYSRLD